MVIRRDPSTLNAKSSDFARGPAHHVARVDASSPGMEKGLCEFFGSKVLACAMPFFGTKLTDRPENCGSKNSFSNQGCVSTGENWGGCDPLIGGSAKKSLLLTITSFTVQRRYIGISGISITVFWAVLWHHPEPGSAQSA